VRPHIPLYEFLPYGAPELLEVRETYLTRALTTSTFSVFVAFLLCAGAFAHFASRSPGALPTLPPIVLYPAPLPPPEYVVRQPSAPHVTPPAQGRVAPVADAVADDTPISMTQSEARTGTDETGASVPIGAAPPTDGGVYVNDHPSLADVVRYDEAPGVVTRVVPAYPDMAREAGVDGSVLLRVLVGRDGRVHDVHVERSVPMLDDAAIDAARRWVFTPALVDGHPIAVWVAIPIRFSLH
jgi:protein TonB